MLIREVWLRSEFSQWLNSDLLLVSFQKLLIKDHEGELVCYLILLL